MHFSTELFKQFNTVIISKISKRK
ncbi:hypothetical protein ACQ27_gp576 [Klebsiella phage K64-1]|nr:hypothetical protein ACQ27_gp576 [Klebsiella phage K64-1]